MNDRRFKELVNLHLDHRLTDGDAIELEQALRNDPARRRVLNSYVKMERGCSALCRGSASGAPAPDFVLRAIRQADRSDRKANASERPFARAWAWGSWSTATVGLAAAVALLVVRVERPSGFANIEGETPSPGIMIAAADDERMAVMVGDVSLSGGADEMSTVASFLPPHLTLAALGISSETREVGVVSNWSQPLNDVTDAEMERAAFWARAASRPDWSVNSNAALRFSGVTIGESAVQTSAASFTFER